jgi:type I restriction-modification system DNA methylase subunit
MTDDLIAQIRSFTLRARAMLEVEAGQQLEGIYGWLPDGAFAAIKGYPAIAKLDEAHETRRRLEQFANDELAAGFLSKEARRKLIRETAFTWLNRLVAIRLMEERKLIKPTIAKLQKSNGFIFWIVEETNAADKREFDKGGLPLNALGEGPTDVAFRHFLLWQCGVLARDVSVLFDPNTLASRLCPRPPVLKQLVEDMNTEALANTWKAGNEETIGWIYEGFIEDENKAVFEKFSAGKKVLAEEIGAATQRFTPRWIVRYLIENSLGRFWVEMHPDSRLKDSLGYLVPVATSEGRPLKLVREISFLDPCCGSMHFGLVAFELFVEMYREEMERAGQPGWPAKASVDSFEVIPGHIIAHNLHGIDLDLRAVQIAAFALLIKARTLQPNSVFTDLNFACSNVEQISGGRLESLITQTKFSHPIHVRILRSLSARMKDSDQLGSLLRLEKVLEQLIIDERRNVEAQPQLKLSLPGASSEQFKTREGIEEFFSKISEQVREQLDQFVSTSRAAGIAPGHLVNEAAKGLRYLRLISRHYDVVATNPPYMSRRNMSVVIADHLDGEFSEAKGDLYAAFIVRCTELAGPLGKIAMITQQSFMFISSYENLREHLRSDTAIEAMVHLGPKAFPNITGEKVNTTAFVFARQPNEERRQEQRGVYFRLVKVPDAESKRRAFETVLSAARKALPDPQLFECVQKDFDAIPGKPWVYWITASLRGVFKSCHGLGDIATVRKGLATCDNKRFVRYWWEVGTSSLRFESKPKTHSCKWNPYVKGGGFRRWYGNQDFVVNWDAGGKELRSYVESINQPVAAESYFFREGITYSYLTTGKFCARQLPTDYIFDAAGSSLFTDYLEPVLGILNSEAAFYFLRLINPTVNFQAGDLRRLPVPRRDLESLSNIVKRAVSIQAANDQHNEITRGFVRPYLSPIEVKNAEDKLINLEAALNEEVYSLFGISDQDRIEILRELADTTEDAVTDTGASVETHTDIASAEAIACSWISYAIGTVLSRFEIHAPHGLGRGDFTDDTAAAIRKLIARDGMLVSDEGHQHDIVRRVLSCLEIMLGCETAHETIRVATRDAGDPEDLLRHWIDHQLWRYHSQLYSKRPIYWPFQSPRKMFTVWIFYECFSKDVLFKISSDFVEPKIRWLEARIKELKSKAVRNNGRERRGSEKEVSQLTDLLDDVQEFAQRLKRVAQSGYTPHVDDGVLLNAAPLWDLLPAWPDTRKAWKELEAAEYDWAHQAMDYWPGRVNEKCRTNKSLAIAQGLA